MATHAGGGGGGAAAAVSRQHKFFKVLLPGSFEIRLRMPPKFAAGLACDSDSHWRRGTATLRDPTGRSWTLDLERDPQHGSTMFFSGGGWRGFVSSNGISAGDVLVFEHRGGLDFAVDMFDPSGCLKTMTDDGAYCRDDNNKEDEAPSSSPVVAKNETMMTEFTTGDKESGNNGRPDAYEKAPLCTTGLKRNSPPSSSTATTTSGTCQREREDDWQQRDHQETVLCRRIQRPYQLRFLDVSKSFCDRLGWAASRDVELCCAARGDDVIDGGDERRRRRWPVSVKVMGKGGMLCGGWTEFAHDNGLRISDACVFLPTSNDDDGHVFQVHVLTPISSP
ncbi:hypothetical protein QOZ80_5BG0448500 [Eleusine coracana subsp. coracana]|nr:hypothetical protein QOZ80_5BG0448500 [Eleusine coracana subsp. coracana]